MIPIGDSPHGIAITPDQSTVYVTNLGSHTVTPIDTTTLRIGTPIAIPVGRSPQHITVTPDSRYLYVASVGVVTSITIIDRANNTIDTLTAFSTPTAPAAGRSSSSAP